MLLLAAQLWRWCTHSIKNEKKLKYKFFGFNIYDCMCSSYRTSRQSLPAAATAQQQRRWRHKVQNQAWGQESFTHLLPLCASTSHKSSATGLVRRQEQGNFYFCPDTRPSAPYITHCLAVPHFTPFTPQPNSLPSSAAALVTKTQEF